MCIFATIDPVRATSSKRSHISEVIIVCDFLAPRDFLRRKVYMKIEKKRNECAERSCSFDEI